MNVYTIRANDGRGMAVIAADDEREAIRAAGELPGRGGQVLFASPAVITSVIEGVPRSVLRGVLDYFEAE